MVKSKNHIKSEDVIKESLVDLFFICLAIVIIITMLISPSIYLQRLNESNEYWEYHEYRF